MEDEVIRRLCLDIAEQILVPSRTFATVAPIANAGATAPRTSGLHAQVQLQHQHQRQQQQSSLEAFLMDRTGSSADNSPRVAALRRAAVAVADRAIALHRLCRSPQYSIPIVGRSGGVGGGGGGGSSAHAGDGGGPLEAALCLCAILAAAQPALWRSLVWRARLVRPRAPVLRLGRPVAVPVTLRDADQFISRSSRLVRLTVGPTMSSANPTASASAAAAPGVATAAVPPRAELDEMLAERVAVCYFFTATTAQERRRCPQILQVDAEVAERWAAERKRAREEEGQTESRLRKEAGRNQRDAGRDYRGRQERGTSSNGTTATSTDVAVDKGPSAGDMLTIYRPSATALWPLQLSILAPPAEGVPGERSSAGTLSRRQWLPGSDDDEDEYGTEEDDGAARRRVEGEDSRLDGGTMRHSRKGKVRRESGEKSSAASAAAADPAALWATLYAFAMEDEAESEIDTDGAAAYHLPHMTTLPSTLVTSASASPLARMPAAAVGLVELAADVEACRAALHHYRLAACLACPLLYRYELFTAAAAGVTRDGGHTEQQEQQQEHTGVALAALHGALGSAYSSACALHCQPFTSTAATAVALQAEGAGSTSHPLDKSSAPITTTAQSPSCMAPPFLCHPGHFLFPARPESAVPSPDPDSSGHPGAPAPLMRPGLLPAANSLVTARFLWTRLLVCASWIAAYADYVLPALLGEVEIDLDVVTRPQENCGGRASQAGREERTHRHRGRCAVRQLLACHLLSSPAAAATLAYCVAVVKEAHQYDCITCPVCDTLSTAVTHQRERYQQQHQQRQQHGGRGGVASGSAAAVAAVVATEAGLRWATLTEERRVLSRSMRLYMTMAAEASAAEEKQRKYARTREDGSDDDTGPTLEEEEGEDNIEVTTSVWVGGAEGRHLRRCWVRFGRATCAVDAVRSFARLPSHSKEERSRDEGEDGGNDSDSECDIAALAGHDTFMRALGHRMHALADLLMGYPIATSGPTRSAAAATNPHSKRPQQHSHAAQALLCQLLGTPSITRGTDETHSSPVAKCEELVNLHEQTVGSLLSAVLFGGRPATHWGPLLLALLLPSCNLPTSDMQRTVEEQGWENNSSAESENPFPREPCNGGFGAPSAASMPGASMGSAVMSHATETADSGQGERSHREHRRLKAQRRQLQELLDFVPQVPVVEECDAVLECAHCASFVHQACVGPVQRDALGSCFLCHTCRLRGGDHAGLAVRPFA